MTKGAHWIGINANFVQVSISPQNSMNYPELQPNKIIPCDSVETDFVNGTPIIVAQSYIKYFILLIFQFKIVVLVI